MSGTTQHPIVQRRFRGPHTGVVAIIYTALFLASLFPVTMFGGLPYFLGPTASVSQMMAFFSQRQTGVLLCAFFQFGAAIALGIFTVSIVSQLQFLGVRAAGTSIASFGGLATAINMMIGSCFLWTLTYVGTAQDPNLLHALYRISFGIGGPGFSVPFGLLLAGASVTAGFYKLLPKWVVVLGVILAVCGELSWFEILNVHLLPLIPITRFPGFIWMIAAGFALPRRIPAKVARDPAHS